MNKYTIEIESEDDILLRELIPHQYEEAVIYFSKQKIKPEQLTPAIGFSTGVDE